MVIGKDSTQHYEDNNKSTSESERAASAAGGRFQDEFRAQNALLKSTGQTIEVAANDVRLGSNGLPVTGDPITNSIFKDRIAGHMHGPQNPSVGNETGTNRVAANSADMEAGLFGPKSSQNAAQYNSILQDFHSLDTNFRKELSAHGMNGAAADQMRQFLYSSNNQNQRDQFLKAYNLTVPQGFNEFESRYGRKAPLAMHWAMEQR